MRALIPRPATDSSSGRKAPLPVVVATVAAIGVVLGAAAWLAANALSPGDGEPAPPEAPLSGPRYCALARVPR